MGPGADQCTMLLRPVGVYLRRAMSGVDQVNWMIKFVGRMEGLQQWRTAQHTRRLSTTGASASLWFQIVGYGHKTCALDLITSSVCTYSIYLSLDRMLSNSVCLCVAGPSSEIVRRVLSGYGDDSWTSWATRLHRTLSRWLRVAYAWTTTYYWIIGTIDSRRWPCA